MTTGRGFALAFLLLLALGSSTAHAAKGTIETINTPATGLAVNETTGNLYALGEGKVSVFDADGNPQFEFGNGVGPEPSQFASSTNGIAIDQATGHVYVLEIQFNYRIQEFEADGTFVRMWGQDVNASKPFTGFETCTAASGDTCQAGQSGSAPGAFSSSGINTAMFLAWDPATGNLLASDGGNRRLQIFSSEGVFVRAISFDSPPQKGSNMPSSAAADSDGHILASGIEIGASGSIGPVHRFTADGTYLGPFGPVGPFQMAIDSTDDHVYLTLVDPATGEWAVSEYGHGGGLLETHALGIPEPSGLAVNSQTGRIYASDRAGERVFVIDEVANPPIPQVTAVDDVTADSATFSGTVNPNGSPFDTNWSFICTPACPGVVGGNAGNGTTDVTVSAEATGLDPNTDYDVRLVAVREFGAGDATSAPLTFTTEAAAPEVLKVEAARVTDTSARLGALIDANNSPTTYRFDYGAGGSLGTAAPASGAGDGGDEVGPRPVFETVTGLAPSTTYRFKVAIESSGGAAESAIVEFTTRSVAEATVPQRSIELVNTPDKSTQTPSGYLTPDGQGVVWSVYTGGPEAPIGLGASFLARRTPAGWMSRSLVPPASEQLAGGEKAYNLYGATDDYSELIFQVGTPPEDGGNQPEVTLVRVKTGGGQETLHVIPPNTDLWASSNMVADGVRHFYMSIGQQIDPSHPAGVRQLYDVAADPPTLISRMPGTPEAPPCGLGGEGAGNDFGGGQRWTSLDGSRVYFETNGSECFGPKHLYMYDNQQTANSADDSTVRVSGPPVAGDDLGGRLLQAGPEGAVVFYSESQLVAEDTDQLRDIYRWSVEAGRQCLTCSLPGVDIMATGHDYRGVHVSEDLSHVYFTTLVPGEAPAREDLYVWRDGEIKYISPSDGLRFPTIGESTPDGNVFVFLTRKSGVTVDDNGGLRQFYRYDDRDGSVECLTCPPPGQPPAAPDELTNAGLALAVKPTQMKSSRLTADGSTFVFLTAAAMVPRDVNGDLDIYQWRNGRISLITDGVTEFSRGVGAAGQLQLMGISGDGVNLLFSTSRALTGHERDSLAQLYVARLGGGLPGPAIPPEPCLEDTCQGPLAAPPPLLNPGSASARGAGNPPSAKPKPRCRKGAVRRKGRCVKRSSARRCAARKATAKQCAGKRRDGQRGGKRGAK